MDRWPVVRADYGPFRFTATHCLPKAAAPHGRRAHGHKWSVWVVCEAVCLLASLPGWVEGVRVTRDGDRGACLVTRKMNGRRSMAKWAIKAEAEIRE